MPIAVPYPNFRRKSQQHSRTAKCALALQPDSGVKLTQLFVIQNGRGQHRGLLRADPGSSEEVGPSYRRSASMPVGPRLTPPRLDADRNRPTDQPDMVIGANSTALRQPCRFTKCSTSALDRVFNGITHRLPALPKQVLSSRRNLMRMSAFGATCRPSGPGEGPESTLCGHSASHSEWLFLPLSGHSRTAAKRLGWVVNCPSRFDRPGIPTL